MQDERDELEGKVEVEKTEDEEKAELEAATNSLAEQADANKRVDDKAKLEEEVSKMNAKLDSGNVDEADVEATKELVAKSEEKITTLEGEIEEDGNKKALESNSNLESEARIKDINISIADLEAKINARESEVAEAVQGIEATIHPKEEVKADPA